MSRGIMLRSHHRSILSKRSICMFLLEKFRIFKKSILPLNVSSETKINLSEKFTEFTFNLGKKNKNRKNDISQKLTKINFNTGQNFSPK